MTKKKAVKTSVRVPCTRRRVADVIAPEDASPMAAKEEATLRRSPRPGSCQKFVRREIADAMPRICADVGGVTLGPAAVSSVLANVATSGSASDLTSGTLDPARLPVGALGGVCASTVAYSAVPTFAVTCANATFHMPLTGNVTSESFTGLSAGQHITLIFQTGSSAGYTVGWSSQVHGGFVTSGTSGAAGYTQAGKYLVQQLVVDTDGTTLLNPRAMNE